MIPSTRLVIVQVGKSNTGKTTTVRLVYDAVVRAYRDHGVVLAGASAREVFAIIEIGGIRIGFQSMGDPSKGRMEEGLRKLVGEGCSAIVCSCRTKGATREAVEGLAGDGYEIDRRPREGSPTDEANHAEVEHAMERLRALLGPA